MTLPLILTHLEKLVSFDTQNPPRDLTADDEIFCYIETVLGTGWTIKKTDYEKGRVSFYATKGTPKILFNVHLDTVPAGDGWTTDPLKLEVKYGKAFGRGACDIKGGAATLLALVKGGISDIAILFTTDEEGSDNYCVSAFCQETDPRQFNLVVVAEPTNAKAVLQHRGYLSVRGDFTGTSGHTSSLNASRESAVHRLVHWAKEALKITNDQTASELSGHCFNLGYLDGGIKPNMVADKASALWSMRPKPGASLDKLFKEMTSLCEGEKATWTKSFVGPGLIGTTSQQQIEKANVPIGPAVDFWTEASLFAAAGFSTVVLGPGDIKQAHAANEWVTLSNLNATYRHYEKLARSK